MAELTGRRRRLFARARAARCTCSAATRTSSAATASSARRCRSAPGSPSRTSIATTSGVCRHLSRRRRGQPGPGLRELQHGGAVEAAGRLRDREQPIRHGHLDRARLGRAPTCSTAATPTASPAQQVDGMDVLAVQRGGASRRSRTARPARGRSSSRCMTYRYRGHSMSDPAKYRTRGGGRRRCAPSTIRSTSCASTCSMAARRRGELKADRQARSRRSCSEAASSPRTARSRIRTELWTDVYRR